MTSNSIIQQVKLYCDLGWRVLPVSDQKIPLLRGWPANATCDFSVAKDWWAKNPSATAIGIATGRLSGLWVIDIDIKNGVNGLESLKNTFKDVDFDAFPPDVESPSGGCHYYFQWPDDPDFKASANVNVIPGVDFRASGSFIITPPSEITVNGGTRSYNWLRDPKDIRPTPDWGLALAELLQRKQQAKSSNGKPASTFDVKAVMEGLPEGSRDAALYRYACHLRGCGVPLELAVGFIQEAAARCIPPFDPATAFEKIERAYTTLPERAETQQRTEIYSLKAGDE